MFFLIIGHAEYVIGYIVHGCYENLLPKVCFYENHENHDFGHSSKTSSNFHILHSDNKPRRFQHVDTSNFAFPISYAAAGASSKVQRPASRRMVNTCQWPWETGRYTSKLAPTAACEIGNAKFGVSTYGKRRCLLFGSKICSCGDMAEVEVKS